MNRKNLHRYSGCLTSYFMVPELGMNSYEVLARASTFLTRWQTVSEENGHNHVPSAANLALPASAILGEESLPARSRRTRPMWGRASALPWYHLIGSGHVTHPFLYRQYYPRDQYPWLDAVREEHTIHKLEICAVETGEIIYEFALENAFRHPSRDLVVLHLQDEEQFTAVMAKEEDNLQEDHADDYHGLKSLHLSKQRLQPGEDVTFVGHLAKDVGLKDEIQIPYIETGNIHTAVGQSVYAKTRERLPMGMCGGPVLNSHNECVGVVEGVVNPPPENSTLGEQRYLFLKAIAGDAAFIPNSEIEAFLQEVEEKMLGAIEQEPPEAEPEYIPPWARR